MKTLEELGYRKRYDNDFDLGYVDYANANEIYIRKDYKTVTKFTFGAQVSLSFDEVKAIAALLEELK